MFTFRFESFSNLNAQENPGDPKKVIQVVQASEYRLLVKSNSTDVMIPNENAVDICYPVGVYPGAYDRCFVMNGNGATVDKIVAEKPAA
ncbi:hypothetical protein [Rosistilla oblonga]|uniref:hypothetical protein n=1 Tax=Rosistilla oblonga TaxID=2527990 RepID=UPI003A96D6A7